MQTWIVYLPQQLFPIQFDPLSTMQLKLITTRLALYQRVIHSNSMYLIRPIHQPVVSINEWVIASMKQRLLRPKQNIFHPKT